MASEAGITIVIEDVFEPSVNDAKPMLTRVKNANPQAIIIWGTAQESAIVTKNVRELGIDLPLIESHGIANSHPLSLRAMLQKVSCFRQAASSYPVS